MKLKDHVLKEHRTIHVVRNNKRYVCRILQKGTLTYHLIAKNYGCSDPFYMDFTQQAYLKRSRRYIMGLYQPVFQKKRWFGFRSFEEAIKWLKENEFKILPSVHRKIRRDLRR